ncbi:hypothetical protein J6590_023772 [Homalodisca vitripennis]|nr:hypothetical protein J6590_023772 [Homalodisca vitripennis]
MEELDVNILWTHKGSKRFKTKPTLMPQENQTDNTENSPQNTRQAPTDLLKAYTCQHTPCVKDVVEAGPALRPTFQ